VNTVDKGHGTPAPNNLKNAAYPQAIDELKADNQLPKKVKLRPKKYLNNIVEQDHRGLKQLVKLGMGFGSFNTAQRTIKGYEMINMIRKAQVSWRCQRRYSSTNRIRVSNFWSSGITRYWPLSSVCPQKVFATQPVPLG
jgi:hypothetical protein